MRTIQSENLLSEDEFVAQGFEGVCQQFLTRQYRDRIQEIGRYWFNDRTQKVDIELDVVMRTEDELAAFECKWTNQKIDRRIVENVVSKSAKLEPDRLGFFSKAGYMQGLNSGHWYYTVDDLYSLSISK